MRLLVFVSVIASASACSSSGDRSDAALDLGASDLSTAPDLAFGTQLCRPSFLNAPPPTGRGGSVTFFITQGGTTNGNASFSTVELDAGASEEQCARAMSGNCETVSCTNTNVPLTTTNESVGTIQVTGGAYPVTFTPAADKTYPPLLDNPLWTGGETLRFVAPGADQPGFDLMVLAPSPVTTTQPIVAGNPPLVVPRSQDLTVTWTGGSSTGFVELSIVAVDAANNSYGALVCEFAASAGAGTLPSSLLRNLPTGSADFTVFNACAQWDSTSSAITFLQLSIEGQGSVHDQSGNITLQ